jgi:ADP-ribose pyrophosphatase YjhB (NUDIX family)
MKFLTNLARKGAYHFLHPILRLYRVYLSPAKDSARVVLTYNNEVMLVRNIGVKRWSLPGGTLDQGETPEACALRELKEELNISDAEIDYKLGAYDGEHHGQPVVVHVFVAKAQSLYHKKQWEIDRAGWFALGQLPPNLSPATARRIGDYKNGLRDTKNFW